MIVFRILTLQSRYVNVQSKYILIRCNDLVSSMEDFILPSIKTPICLVKKEFNLFTSCLTTEYTTLSTQN